ncbi:MAG: DUF1552 domain-containing protein [Candidatus Binatia bacterium]|nr:DUF1552 domain-containing protein [Candidatus Binatia bacterium]
MKRRISRRTVLRGMASGGAVAIGLPLFDYFLNDNGTALAQGGLLPVRFGTWFWGCGINPDRWIPSSEGAEYDIAPELAALADVKSQVSVLSGFNTILDGRANWPHSTGVAAMLTGSTPEQDGQFPDTTLDIQIAREIGGATRFRSLEMAATGNPRQSYSREGTTSTNPSTVSPLEMYTRLFGPGFVDPNDTQQAPDPRTLLRQSALSVVQDDVARLEKLLGSHDRQRLDQYFTSLRQLEQQIELSLSPPELEGCTRPDEPRGEELGTDLPQAAATHRMLTDLLVFGLLCDQTRVFNMLFSWGLSGLRQPGSSAAHHELTHDELVDAELGYQPQATAFALASMDAWAEFVRTLAATSEGAGTLLDSCLVLGHSESSFAKSHDVTGLPVMIAGRAGGALRPGIHVRGNGEPVTRIGLTVQQVMGLPIEEWGTRSMQVNQPISEILA